MQIQSLNNINLSKYSDNPKCSEVFLSNTPYLSVKSIISR
ncbi:hypothetical protein PPEP_a2303 [Pseudoalteromonas peptidolytica F12-50-A1]|uniref:Uncharacterized protein n=1 Tax=Pseudoalteromonas peptidolytica F12-50-A1 TaxID=1315280 RepID=A0A8I0T1L3_9GAMM|nr:hypothetical protein [Pseudoalteromonas peptidolytica F12-50-A1]